MRYVLCHSGKKRPIGNDWPNHTLSADELAQRLAEQPALTVGILLGPASGVVDVECDSTAATEAFAVVFGTPHTPSWRSTRGTHTLFAWDARLVGLPAVVKWKNIEFRLGTRAAQSICPPSVVDGVRREWVIRPGDCPLAPLPENVIVALLGTPTATRGDDGGPDELFAGLHRELQRAKVLELTAYFARNGNPVQHSHTTPSGVVYLHLSHCPAKTPGHGGGDPCALVKADGGHVYKCQHANCAGRGWSDVEDVYGGLHPIIKTGPDLYRMTSESISALRADPSVYQRCRSLVEICHEAPKPAQCQQDDGGPIFRVIPHATLAVKLSSRATYKKFDGRAKKHVPCSPPDPIVCAVQASPAYPGIRVVTGLASCPILRADGTVASAPGYDPETGIFLAAQGEWPALMTVTQAVDVLLDVLTDFPFGAAVYRSAFLSALITLLSRSAFAGCAPLFWFDGNAPRVGKGLLTDLLTTIAFGLRAARNTWSSDKEELRKLVSSLVLAGKSYCLFDNVATRLGGPTLENVLTASRWSDRALGKNEHIDAPLSLTWLATSNNGELTSDQVERTVRIRLESELENPGQRTDFKYPDLLDYATTHRRELAIAGLSIPAAYLKAGRPKQALSGWGGFQPWSDFVRSAIVWAGLPDPDTRKILVDEVDESRDVLRSLMAGWRELKVPTSVSAALALLRNEVDGFAALRAAVNSFPDRDQERTIGTLLRGYRGRVLDGHKFEGRGSKPVQWQVVVVKGGKS
jgi:hypothetical protein